MQIIKKFKIVICRCGLAQIIGSLTLSCKRCRGTYALKVKSKAGLNLKLIDSFEKGWEAQRALIIYTNELNKGKFQGFKEFDCG